MVKIMALSDLTISKRTEKLHHSLKKSLMHKIIAKPKKITPARLMVIQYEHHQLSGYSTEGTLQLSRLSYLIIHQFLTIGEFLEAIQVKTHGR